VLPYQADGFTTSVITSKHWQDEDELAAMGIDLSRVNVRE